jgi:hypothetical protein
MIGKIAPKGKSLRALAAYLLRAGRGHIVAGPMAGRTPRELSREFRALRRLNPKLTKAVAHLMLSPAPADPPLTDALWRAIAERYMEAMGFGNAPWLAVVHQDTDHQHMHLMACRISFDGKTVSDANDFRKSEAVVRKLEIEFGLAVVASPDGFMSKPHTRTKNETKNDKKDNNNHNHQGGTTMTESEISPNPFNPSDSQHATWPQPFEPGRDQAELALLATSPSIVMPGASPAEHLTESARRSMRRSLVEDNYVQRMHLLLGDDLTRVHRHAQGATLYFKQPGRIADQGYKLTVLGGMDEKLAAQRIVAMACGKGWKTITFTGSGSFVERAMREALERGLTVVASTAGQAAILARVMAERERSICGAVMHRSAMTPPLQAAHTSPQPWPKPAPTSQPVEPPADSPPAAPPDPAPRQPVVGVIPAYLNLRERLQSKRQLHAPATPTPTPTQPAAPRKPGGP